MKIRSHTGNMVEARVGMVCVVEKSAIPVTIESIEGDCAWCSFDVSCDARRMIYASTHLTMLSCPFMVGDETEFLYTLPDNWIENGRIERQLEADRCNDSSRVRHSNPDLRAKGEV